MRFSEGRAFMLQHDAVEPGQRLHNSHSLARRTGRKPVSTRAAAMPAARALPPPGGCSRARRSAAKGQYLPLWCLSLTRGRAQGFGVGPRLVLPLQQMRTPPLHRVGGRVGQVAKAQSTDVTWHVEVKAAIRIQLASCSEPTSSRLVVSVLNVGSVREFLRTCLAAIVSLVEQPAGPAAYRARLVDGRTLPI